MDPAGAGTNEGQLQPARAKTHTHTHTLARGLIRSRLSISPLNGQMMRRRWVSGERKLDYRPLSAQARPVGISSEDKRTMAKVRFLLVLQLSELKFGVTLDPAATNGVLPAQDGPRTEGLVCCTLVVCRFEESTSSKSSCEVIPTLLIAVTCMPELSDLTLH